MQVLKPDRPRGRVGFVVGRWTEDDPALDVQGTPFRCMPVVGSLLNAGFEVVFFDQELDQDRNDRTGRLRAELAGVELVLLWAPELWPQTVLANLLRITALLRSWYPALKLVAGGVPFEVMPPRMLDCDHPWTAILQGFGEDHVVELAEALLAGRSPAAPGAAWREEGRFHRLPIANRPRFADADHGTAYRLLDLSEHLLRGGIFGNGEPTLVIGTGRGCAKGCGFCYWRNGAPAIARAEWILDTAAFLRSRYGVRQFHFAELDFFTNRSRPLALARAWRERLPDSVWFALCSPIDALRFTASEWDEIAAGGCAKVELGSESGSPRVLRRIGKKHAPEDSLRINRWLVDRGLHVMHNFILGFPDETAGDRGATVDLMERLWRQSPERVTFAPRLWQAIPDTPLGDDALEHSPAFPSTLAEVAEYRLGYAGESGRAMPWIPEEDERAAKQLISHWLPLAISRLPVDGAVRGALYRGLRRLAWWRARRQEFRLPVDRWLYSRWFSQVLSRTWRP